MIREQLRKHQKKVVGAFVAAMLSIVGAIYNVDLSDQKESITNQVDNAITGKLEIKMPDQLSSNMNAALFDAGTMLDAGE